MKYDKNLNPISDGNDNGSGSVSGVTIKSDSARTDTTGTSGDSSGANGNDQTSGISREAGSDLADGDFIAPHGDAKSARANDPTRTTASGSGRGRSSRGRSNSGDSGTAGAASGGRKTAQAGAGSDTEDVPREVTIASLSSGKDAKKNRALTIEFLSEGWTLAFKGAGFLMRDKEWEIESDGDAQELAERTHNWLASLDRKKSAAWEKALAKWQPLLSLAMALIAIVGPRLAHTREKRRALYLQAQRDAANRTGASNIRTQAPAPAPISPKGVFEAGIIESDARGNGHANKAERPLRREDWNEIFGHDDG